jgi:hypothetical protein
MPLTQAMGVLGLQDYKTEVRMLQYFSSLPSAEPTPCMAREEHRISEVEELVAGELLTNLMQPAEDKHLQAGERRPMSPPSGL